MSLEDGAKTIVDQCLNISEGEKVVVVNDGNDPDLIDSLMSVLEQRTDNVTYIEYPEPERQGMEPPESVAVALKNSDVFIAPTLKSISHTNARRDACKNGARGATLPTINKQIWNSALQADYDRVTEITGQAIESFNGVSEVRVETSKGTKLEFEVDSGLAHPDKGIAHESGDFVNLPGGEFYTGPLDANGRLVLEHMPFGTEEDVGTTLVIEGGRVVDVEDAPANSDVREAVENVENADNIAEFGFGTNPEAFVIDNPLQDEKVLGTIHVAIGDNAFCFPDGHEKKRESDIHWDFTCDNPTVYFDGEKVLDNGEPVFLDDQ